MSISILSLKSEESRCIKNGNYKLYFENDNLCISDGIKTLSINLNNYEIYDPTTSTALLPYNYNGDVGYRILTVSDCIMELLTQIKSVIDWGSFSLDGLHLPQTNKTLNFTITK